MVDKGVSVHLFSCDLLSASHRAGAQTHSPSRLTGFSVVWEGRQCRDPWDNRTTEAVITAVQERVSAPLERLTGSLALESLC